MENGRNRSISLSHSLSEAFCPQQEYLKRIVGLRDHEKYDYAKGHLGETIAYAWLNNERTGASMVSLKEAGLQKLNALQNEMEYEDHRRLTDKFDDILEGVTRYCQSIDYTPVHLSKRFKLRALGFTRLISGEMDIVAERNGPLVIDLKVQEKPLEMKSFKAWKQGWVRQLVLYSMAWMTMNNSDTPPQLEIHVIVFGQDPQRFTVTATEDLMYTVFDNLHNLNLRLDADYWPMNREHNLCSQRFCHVYGYCHQHNHLNKENILDRLNISV